MERKIHFTINFSNRVLYSAIILGVLILVTFGVWAFGGNNPSVVGHSAGELDLSAGVNGPSAFNGPTTFHEQVAFLKNVNFWKKVNIVENLSLTGPGAGIKFPDGSVQKKGGITDLYISPEGKHIVGGGKCPKGYTFIASVADCGNSYCNGNQIFCVKYG